VSNGPLNKPFLTLLQSNTRCLPNDDECLQSRDVRAIGAFVRDTISLAGIGEGDQPSLWQDRVRLDDGFWQSLQAHPVPVREEAIRAMGARSLAIDEYI
jgi:hypothetical protein